MYVLLKIIQRYTKIGFRTNNNKKSNFKIENIIYIDAEMKIINLSYQSEITYIIAVGKSYSFLIDKHKLLIDKNKLK